MAITVEDENLGHATAYAYAKSKGYAGTEEEFAEDLKKSAEYADNAAASASSASESATNAANSATAAGNAQTAAESAKTAAQSAQTAAESAKTSAQSSATSAGNSATDASGSASNASASANSAASSASSASSSASSASASATAAGNSATSAGASATNASTSATSAASSATAASGSATDAQNAKTAAQNAQTAAEAARDAAQGYAESIDPDTLAKKDGTYEDLTSGNAEQLLSDIYTENSEPYLFRKTGGNSNREYLNKIIGGSLVWNQLYRTPVQGGTVSSTVTYTVDSSRATITLNGTASTVGYIDHSWMAKSIINHVYYVDRGTTVNGLQLYNDNNGVIANDSKPQSIGKATAETDFYLRVSNNAEFSNTVAKPQLIDLTAAFGTTIADYVYNLGTATAGSGIAWLKQYIDLDTYHAYSTPTLKHVEGLVSHDTVGFNLWDEVNERGYWDVTTGEKMDDANWKRCANYIPCLPNTSYFFKCTQPSSGSFGALLFYDADKNIISYKNRSVINQASVTPSNCYYMTFYASIAYFDNGICINLSDPQKNGIYKPYQKHSYPLDSSVVLRGIPTLVDGKLKYDGDEYLPDGTIDRAKKLVDMGTLPWQYITTSDRNYFYVSISGKNGGAVISDAYAYGGSKLDSQMADAADKMIYTETGYKAIKIKDSAYTDANAFKTAVTGKYILYGLLTHENEQAEPYRQLQICDTYGTEAFVTTSEVPVGTETRYPEDLKSKIEGLPWDLSMIAPIENGTTASQAYTAGQYFLHNNVFCKALANIASGATFTLGTNYSETTIAAELYTALH